MDQLDRSDYARTARDPGGNPQDALPSGGRLGEGQDVRLPVGRAFGIVCDLAQPRLDPLEPVGPPAISPAGRHRGPAEILIQRGQGSEREGACHRVDHEHNERTQDGSGEARTGVKKSEPWTKRQTGTRGLDVGRVIQQPVGDQKNIDTSAAIALRSPIAIVTSAITAVSTTPRRGLPDGP